MAITDTIFQGEDKTIEIVVKDENGTAIDLGTADGIVVYVLDEGNNIIQKYSEETQTGFKSITVTDPSNGKMEIMLQSADTTTASIGIIRAEIKLEFTDAGFDDSTFHSVDLVVDIAQVKFARTTGETDLTP